jgi:hypothetical protein
MAVSASLLNESNFPYGKRYKPVRRNPCYSRFLFCVYVPWRFFGSLKTTFWNQNLELVLMAVSACLLDESNFPTGKRYKPVRRNPCYSRFLFCVHLPWRLFGLLTTAFWNQDLELVLMAVSASLQDESNFPNGKRYKPVRVNPYYSRFLFCVHLPWRLFGLIMTAF